MNDSFNILDDSGRLFIVGIHGTAWNNEIREFLDELRPAGVILFSRNIESPRQLAELNRSLQKWSWSARSDGLFIGIDQEGGRVRRLGPPYTVYPPAFELASLNDPLGAVREFAAVTACELKLSGFNVDFVPVLDVLSSNDDMGTTVIGDRSYGFRPDTVALLGMEVVRSMRAAGIIPCAKHFPGHGGTLLDSHIQLPIDERPLEVLKSRDLVPFEEAVREGVEMIMTAHVLFSSIDHDLPATLSPKIVEGLLRTELGYAGIIVTDDLDMAAVADKFSAGECTVTAVNAGADLVLICREPLRAIAARDRTAQAIQDGELPRSRVEASLRRTRLLKESYAGSFKPCSPDELEEYLNSQARSSI
ncbi:MAG: beta-N-acetylhexosaminidase [Pseudomonadota bacterium]